MLLRWLFLAPVVMGLFRVSMVGCHGPHGGGGDAGGGDLATESPGSPADAPFDGIDEPPGGAPDASRAEPPLDLPGEAPAPVDTAPEVAAPRCASAADCPSKEACLDGRCGAGCDDSHPCNGGCCQGGLCVSGRAFDACGATGGVCSRCYESQQCACGICQAPCSLDEDCPQGTACDDQTGTCGASCKASCNGGCCGGGSCQAGSTNQACGGSGQCVDCTSAIAGHVCVAGSHCGCASDADCPAGKNCDSATHVCLGCQGPGDCPPGLACQADGSCAAGCGWICPGDPATCFLALCNGGCCLRTPQDDGTFQYLCAPGRDRRACGDNGGVCTDCVERHIADYIGCWRGRRCGCQSDGDCPPSRGAGKRCLTRIGWCATGCGEFLGDCPEGMCCDLDPNWSPGSVGPPGRCAPGDVAAACGGYGTCRLCGHRSCLKGPAGASGCSGSVCLHDRTCGESTCAPVAAEPDYATAPPLQLPTLPGGSTRVVQLALGRNHSCVLFSTGSILCWGGGPAQGHGRDIVVGDDETPAAVPLLELGGRAVQITAGAEHTCALLDNGRIRCWGKNLGQLGYPATEDIGDNETPASVGDVALPRRAVQVVAGEFHTCALLENGNVSCWGKNGAVQGRVGDAEPIGGRVVQISAGSQHTCALLETGSVRCWGLGVSGALGYGNINDIGDNEAPADIGDVPVGAPVARLMLGGRQSCVRLEDGTHHCWGSGNPGSPGSDIDNLGDDEPASTPRSLVDAGDPIREIAIGIYELHALLDTGQVREWFGAPRSTNAPRPDPAVGGKAVQIASGEQHACLILDTGAVRCWGSNAFGRLGYGRTGVLFDEPADGGDVDLGTR